MRPRTDMHSARRRLRYGRQVLSLHFLAGQPVLMSSACDNALKHWAFDLEARWR